MTLWHEYAIEPNALENYDRALRVLSGIGFGKSRLVSGIPKKWAQKVRNKSYDFSAIDNLRVVEVLNRLKDEGCILKRETEYDGTKPFVENAFNNRKTHPFRAVISKKNPENMTEVLEISSNFEDSHLWKDVRKTDIERTGSALAKCIEPILRNATSLMIIDPYWLRDNRPKWVKPIEAIANLVKDKNIFEQIEIHCGRFINDPEFESNCKKRLLNVFKEDISVSVMGWDVNKNSKIPFHDRYIISNIGGATITPGIDVKKFSQYSLTTLSKSECDKIRKRFSLENEIYELIQKVTVQKATV